VLSVAAARNVDMASDVTLEVFPDEDGLPDFRIDVASGSDRASVHSTLQSAVAAVGRLGPSNLRKVAEAGYVVFKRVGTSRWSAVPRFSDCRGEVKVGLSPRLTASIGARLGKLRLSGDWSFTVDPVSINKAEDALRRLLARGDLPHIISGVTVSGGGPHRPSLAGAPVVASEDRERSRHPRHHRRGRRRCPDADLQGGRAERLCDQVASACPARSIRSSLNTSSRLHFVADAFVHEGQTPPNLIEAPEWSDAVEMLSRTAEPQHAPVPEAMDDLLEAIYPGGRRGWSEALLMPLLERVLPAEINPWDFLRSLHDATVMRPLLRARHRGCTWVLVTHRWCRCARAPRTSSWSTEVFPRFDAGTSSKPSRRSVAVHSGGRRRHGALR
jgi:hypothetical protein